MDAPGYTALSSVRMGAESISGAGVGNPVRRFSTLINMPKSPRKPRIRCPDCGSVGKTTVLDRVPDP